MVRWLAIISIGILTFEPAAPHYRWSGTDSTNYESTITNSPSERIFVQAGLHEVANTGSAIATPFQSPTLLRGRGQNLYLFDYGDRLLKAVSWSGDLRWTIGGDGTFVNPTDIQLDVEGNLWVVDARTTRVTVVSPDGEITKSFAVDRTVTQLIPLGAGEFLGISNQGPYIAYWYDSRGQLRTTVDTPEWLREIDTLARQVRTGHGEGNRGVMGFLYADGFISVRVTDDRAVRLDYYRGIEPMEFPDVLTLPTDVGPMSRVSPQAVEGIRYIDMRGDRLYMLFGGRSEHTRQLLDMYDFTDGEYLRTLRLPEPVDQIAVLDENMIAVLIKRPIPIVKVWRITEDAGRQ